MSKSINLYLLSFIILLCVPHFPQMNNTGRLFFPSRTFHLPDHYLLMKHTDGIMKMDSIITNSVPGTDSKHTFQYNTNEKISEWMTCRDTGNGLCNSMKTEYMYDRLDTLMSEIHFGWNLNGWDSLSRTDYFYSEGKLAKYIIQEFTSTGWNNLWRYTYKYLLNGDIKSIMIEDWINDNWQYNTLISYFYSCSNMTMLFQHWINDNWQDSLNTDFFYNEQGDQDSAVTRKWDGSAWINFNKLEFTNDNNHNRIEQILKIWESNDWQNSVRCSYTYNELNYIESAACKLWIDNQWVEGDGEIIFENPDGFKAVLTANNVSVYYVQPVNTDDYPETHTPGYALFQNYPNPFNPATTIKYQIPISGFVELKIYDVLGRVVEVLMNEYETSGAYELRFDAGNLASGVYFYSLRSGGFVATGKMMLEK